MSAASFASVGPLFLDIIPPLNDHGVVESATSAIGHLALLCGVKLSFVIGAEVE